MTKHRMTILCVDDHVIVREGIEFIIGLERDMNVVASAATGAEAIEQFRAHGPDVTVLDLRLPDMSGLEVIRVMRRERPGARIVVLSAHHRSEDIRHALDAGASSYVLKETASRELVRILREVHSGQRAIPHDVATLYDEPDAPRGLTSREREVLRLMAIGHRNKEIANALGISPLTSQAHTKKIFAKLEVHDRTAAVTKAVKEGIIDLE